MGRWQDCFLALAPQLYAAIARLGHHVACPVHGGKDGFRLYPDSAATGGGICNTCYNPRTGKLGFPDGFDLLAWVNGWDFTTTLRRVAGWLGMTSGEHMSSRTVRAKVAVSPARLEPDQRKRAALNLVWEASLPADHPTADPMRRYLASRGILVNPIPEALRFHPALPYHHGRELVGTYPAMVALVAGPDGRPVSIHRTYLTPDGRKASPEWNGERLDSRKLMSPPTPGATRGGSIRLFEGADRLGVSEGVETALAAFVLSGGKLPIWATVSAGGMESVVIPPHVRTVIILADRDPNGRGQESAIKLARRLVAEGRIVKRILPPEALGEKADWNDVTQGRTANVG